MRRLAQAILSTILVLHLPRVAAQATSSHPGDDAPASLCLAKTINHITHTLPQQCLKGSWTSPTSEPLSVQTESPTHESQSSEQDAPEPTTTDTVTPKRQHDKPILSFEEWKELMLRQHGQDPADLQERQRPEPPRVAHQADPGLGTFGEEGEIALNFDVPPVPIQEAGGAHAAPADELDSLLDDDGRAQYSRSKDAGKTCKERFSYSSFDAGATVLKASPGTKNPKAILVEHKDSYMLFECTAEEKYVIVELSDDILVDTIVLANFEFFSSMIRHFRVSVSDRYPIKSEKWKQLGIFEAKNARDIQPFLVENPQIWAKYVRVDFLSYYGNEYYCPVSLLRVHGTRMLESWKETEGIPEDEDSEHESVSRGYLEATTHEDSTSTFDPQASVSAVHDAFFLFGILQPTCPAPTVPMTGTGPPWPDNLGQDGADSVEAHGASSVASQHSGPKPTDSSADSPSPPNANATMSTSISSIPTPAPSGGGSRYGAADAPTSTAHSSSSISDVPMQSNSAEPVSSQPRNRTTTSSGQPTLPTVQESFFKTVTKRLQLLESNMTWSLKYVEDQSRYIQEALAQVEGKRLSEAEALLDQLNRTVHVELGALRQRYEEVWQSTVIALETQREQSQAELVALSSRLNVLADEVVFQKRMSIGQSTLLLCCLVLIIFSRSVSSTMPLVNWQPGPGSAFPGSPGPSQSVFRAIAGASSARNARNRKPSASAQSDELDHCSTAKPQADRGPIYHGERAFVRDIGELCSQYQTPEDDVSEQAGLERPFHTFGLCHEEDDGNNANLGEMPGIGGEKKPLPPLPE